jgi:hypothetical protein
MFMLGRLLIACLFVVSVAGCDIEAGLGGPNVNTNRAVTIGLLVPQQSTDAGVAALANSLTRAAQLAVEENPDTRIDLRVYATAGSPETAAAAARQAVGDGAKIIIGPLFAESATAARSAVSASAVNILSFSNNADIAGGGLFILGNSFRNTADRLVGYAAARGLTRIAAVAPRNAAGNSAASEISSAASKFGAQFTGTSTYDFNLNSVVQSAPVIAIEVKSAGASAIVLTADSAGALPLLAQLLPENGLDPQETKYMGLARWDIPPENLVQRGLQGGWFAVPDFAAADSFKRRYVTAFGSDPHPLAGLAYDGVATVAQLLRTGRSDALSGVALVTAPGFTGASGEFRYLPDGTVQRGLAVAEVSNGTYRIIDPAPRTFGGAGF